MPCAISGDVVQQPTHHYYEVTYQNDPFQTRRKEICVKPMGRHLVVLVHAQFMHKLGDGIEESEVCGL